MKVTAVLLKYKRPYELEKIIEHLKTKSYIDEILVCDNSGDNNIINYGRYVMAAKAKNDNIYTQDDDCIINNMDKIFSYYDGTKLVNGLKPSHLGMYIGQTSMCGWGTFFNKNWINVLDKYIDKYGKDYLFYRECDRIFTGLLKDRLTVGADVTDFLSAEEDFALYKHPEHNNYAQMAKDRVNEIINSSAQ